MVSEKMGALLQNVGSIKSRINRTLKTANCKSCGNTHFTKKPQGRVLKASLHMVMKTIIIFEIFLSRNKCSYALLQTDIVWGVLPFDFIILIFGYYGILMFVCQ